MQSWVCDVPIFKPFDLGTFFQVQDESNSIHTLPNARDWIGKKFITNYNIDIYTHKVQSSTIN
jgi:hypothetical protein